MAIPNSKKAATGFVKDFQEFILRGNVLDLAVAVIIGAAFGKIVSGFVDNMIMPLVSAVIPGGSWREAKFVLGSIPDPADKTKTKMIENAILYGQFLGTVVDFVIIALVIFTIVRLVAAFKRKEDQVVASDTRECNYCLSTIPLKATRCSHCASDLPPVM